MDGIGEFTVTRVEIRNLRFTSDGVGGIMMFLALQVASVDHLVIHNVVGSSPTKEDEQALGCLAVAFADAPLRTLDLSHNTLGSYVWDSFGNHKNLHTLMLEEVDMDNSSLNTLYELIKKTGNRLSKLCVSNAYALMNDESFVGHSIVSRCPNLRFLKWSNLSNHAGAPLPSLGIYQVSELMMTSVDSLRRLELDGATLSDLDFSVDNGICGALQRFDRLDVLKLRSLGINRERLREIIISLEVAKPPLRILDLSHNRLGNDGARRLAELFEIRSIKANMRKLVVQNNDIGNKGAAGFLSKMGGIPLKELDIIMLENPLDMTTVALNFAATKKQTEQERDSIKLQRDRLRENSNEANADKEKVRNLLAAQASMVSDMQALQQEIDEIRKQRDAMIAAFSVMGSVNAADERNSILMRLERLEESVHGKSSAGKHTASSLQRPRDTSRSNGSANNGSKVHDRDPRLESCFGTEVRSPATSEPEVRRSDRLARASSMRRDSFGGTLKREGRGVQRSDSFDDTTTFRRRAQAGQDKAGGPEVDLPNNSHSQLNERPPLRRIQSSSSRSSDRFQRLLHSQMSSHRSISHAFDAEVPLKGEETHPEVNSSSHSRSRSRSLSRSRSGRRRTAGTSLSSFIDSDESRPDPVPGSSSQSLPAISRPKPSRFAENQQEVQPPSMPRSSRPPSNNLERAQETEHQPDQAPKERNAGSLGAFMQRDELSRDKPSIDSDTQSLPAKMQSDVAKRITREGSFHSLEDSDIMNKIDESVEENKVSSKGFLSGYRTKLKKFKKKTSKNEAV